MAECEGARVRRREGTRAWVRGQRGVGSAQGYALVEDGEDHVDVELEQSTQRPQRIAREGRENLCKGRPEEMNDSQAGPGRDRGGARERERADGLAVWVRIRRGENLHQSYVPTGEAGDVQGGWADEYGLAVVRPPRPDRSFRRSLCGVTLCRRLTERLDR